MGHEIGFPVAGGSQYLSIIGVCCYDGCLSSALFWKGWKKEEKGVQFWGYPWINAPFLSSYPGLQRFLTHCPTLPLPSQGSGILLCEDDSLYEGTFTRDLSLTGKVRITAAHWDLSYGLSQHLGPRAGGGGVQLCMKGGCLFTWEGQAVYEPGGTVQHSCVRGPVVVSPFSQLPSEPRQESQSPGPVCMCPDCPYRRPMCLDGRPPLWQ